MLIQYRASVHVLISIVLMFMGLNPLFELKQVASLLCKLCNIKICIYCDKFMAGQMGCAINVGAYPQTL